jgi:hypothetical protein
LIDDETWQYMVPAPFSTHRNVERFEGITDPVFDRESAARVAADLTIGNILQPERISRLAMTSGAASTFRPRRLVVELVDFVWRQPVTVQRESEILQVVKQSLTDHLLKLSSSTDASVSAKAVASFGLTRVIQYLDSVTAGAGSSDREFALNMMNEIRRFQTRPYPQFEPQKSIPAPPGSPIGSQR